VWVKQTVGIFTAVVDIQTFKVDKDNDDVTDGSTISRAHIVSVVVEVDTDVNNTL